MNQIIINGKTLNVSGRNISIVGDSVIVDGLKVQSGLSGIVEVHFTGDLASLKAHNATVNGNITGSVESHNLHCMDIGGDVKAHNVDCNVIKGSVNAKNVST